MRLPTVLVTGGAGFIGTHLVRALSSCGASVRVLDDFSSRRVSPAGQPQGVDVVQGDVRDGRDLRLALRGIVTVFHLAADPSTPGSITDPLRSHDINTTGTLTVLNAALESGVKKVIFASSASVYGNVSSLPIREDSVLRPVSPYGATKLAGEAYCLGFTSAYGLPTIALRYFNVFGPGQDPESCYVVPQFTTALLKKQPVVIYGDGSQTRDFVFVDDVVRANLLASSAGQDAFGRVLNVGSGRRTSIREVLRLIQTIVGGKDPEIQWADARRGDIDHEQADLDAVRTFIGFEPKTNLEAGLAGTVEWIRRGISVER